MKVGKAVSNMENAERRASIASGMRYNREERSAQRARAYTDKVKKAAWGDNYDGERALAAARDSYRDSLKIKKHRE